MILLIKKVWFKLEEWKGFALAMGAIFTAGISAIRIFGAKKQNDLGNGNHEKSNSSESSKLHERIATLEEGHKNSSEKIASIKDETEKIWRELGAIDDQFTGFVGDIRGRIGEIVGQLESLK